MQSEKFEKKSTRIFQKQSVAKLTPVIPTECPVLGIKLNLKIPNRGDRGDNLRNYDSPSLDKIIPSLGYAKGNIWVISYRANTIKNNCTFEEIQKLYEALLKLEVNSQ